MKEQVRGLAQEQIPVIVFGFDHELYGFFIWILGQLLKNFANRDGSGRVHRRCIWIGVIECDRKALNLIVITQSLYEDFT